MLHYENLWRHLIMDAENDIAFLDEEDFLQTYDEELFDRDSPAPEVEAAATMLLGWNSGLNYGIFNKFMLDNDPKCWLEWNDKGHYTEAMLDESPDGGLRYLVINWAEII